MKKYLLPLLLLAANTQAIITDYVVLKSPDKKKTIYLFGDHHVPHEELAEEQVSALKFIFSKIPKASAHLETYMSALRTFFSADSTFEPEMNLTQEICTAIRDQLKFLLGFIKNWPKIIQEAQFYKTLHAFQGENPYNLVLSRLVYQGLFKYNDQFKIITRDFKSKKIHEDIREMFYLNFINEAYIREKFNKLSNNQDIEFDIKSLLTASRPKTVNNSLDLLDLQILEDILYSENNNIMAICGVVHVERLLRTLLALGYSVIKTSSLNDTISLGDSSKKSIFFQIDKMMESKSNEIFGKHSYKNCCFTFSTVVKILLYKAIKVDIVESLREQYAQECLKIFKPLSFEELMTAILDQQTITPSNKEQEILA